MSAHLYLIQTEDLAGNLLPGVEMHAQSPNGAWAGMTNPCGQFAPTLAEGAYAVDFYLHGKLIGHRDWNLGDPPLAAIRVGLDPGVPTWTNKALRAIKGSIWPTRGPVAFGPRSGQQDNIIDSGCFAYGVPDVATAIAAFHKCGYTHVQVGPFVDPGYHGQYPAIDFRTNPDDVLAWLEAWWAAGFAVVAFIGPDGWTTEQMKTLEPIFSQPRWQAVLKMIVPMGWEPSEDTSNAQFVERFQWAKRVFPNALQYIHLAADFDAPGDNNDFTLGQPKYIGYAEAWARVVPYLTGFLIQNGPYGTTPQADPTLATNFGNQFRADVRGTLRDRFVNGYAGWPTFSANGGPLDLIAAEQTSYYAYWNNQPEATSIAWGTVAHQNGADGYFDSGPA